MLVSACRATIHRDLQLASGPAGVGVFLPLPSAMSSLSPCKTLPTSGGLVNMLLGREPWAMFRLQVPAVCVHLDRILPAL